MIKKYTRKITEYLNIQMSRDILNELNLRSCRLFLITGILTCMLIAAVDRILNQTWSPVYILSLVSFSVLGGIYFSNRNYVCENSTFMLEIFAVCILFFLAYVEPSARRDNPVVAFLVALVIIPPLIADRPWRLLLVILSAGMMALFFCVYVEFPEIRKMDLLRIISVTFLSSVLTCYIDHTRLEILLKQAASQTSAAHDPLTGVLNRGGGTSLIEECLQEQMSGTFLIIDIDDFKHVNDTYGHQRGDEVLQEVASILKHSFKSTDIVMRMGGDEFIVYAVGLADERVAGYRLEKLVEEAARVPAGRSGPEHISISIGGVVNDGTYPTYESLYRTADRHLYDTKSKGKNGFRLHSVSFREDTI